MLRQSGPENVNSTDQGIQPWHIVLRGLREASGVTQEGWAAYLGYGRRTIQRWERGQTVPDEAAAEALLQLCADRGLYRTYRRGMLAGVSISAPMLRELITDARLSGKSGKSAGGRFEESRATPALVHLTQRTSNARVHNLPEDLTSFVGRVTERAELAELLGSARLVTLTGTGGAGKIRLALVAARDSIAKFPDGVWFVELGDLRQSASLVQRVAMTVGAREIPGVDIEDTLVEFLRSRHLHLLLDNCEHLLSGCHKLAMRILRECAHLRVLATSREPLGVPGEVVWRVPSLALPGDDFEIMSESFKRTEAVQLFVERSRAQVPAFELTPINAASIARVCRRLDGIPLAIELAAARSGVLSPAEIDARLDDGFRLLTMSAGPERPSRLQTLRASIDWSYASLDDDEKLLFDRVSVFPGDFDLEALEAVCAFGMPGEAFGPLARLVDKSLVLADPLTDDGITRYRLLETLRAYGVERLKDREEANTMQLRHAHWVADRADEIDRAIHGPEQQVWFRWMIRADGSVRAAFDWAIEHEVEVALRICAGLAWTWGVMGRASQARDWLARALEHPESHSYPGYRARVVACLSMMSILRGDLGGARRFSSQVLDEEEGRRDPVASLIASVARVQILQDAGDPVASEVAEEVTRRAHDQGNTWYLIRITEIQARAALRNGDAASAITQLEEGVRLARGAGDTWSLSQVLNNLGDVARAAGRHVDAGKMYEESLALRQSLSIPGLTPSLRHNLGYVALAAGAPTEAQAEFQDAMSEYIQTNDRRGIAECLIGLASVEAAQGRSVEAARKFGAGFGALESLGASIWPANRADVERWHRLAQSALGDDEFHQIFDEMFASSLDDALELAINTLHT